LNGQRPLALLNRYLQPLLAQDIDTLVLGCTHYPFLKPLIEKIAGPEVMIIDPSPAVSRQLYRILEKCHLLADSDRPGGARYFTSGCIARTTPIINRLLGRTVALESLPLTSPRC
jgi:glutamate racemase